MQVRRALLAAGLVCLLGAGVEAAPALPKPAPSPAPNCQETEAFLRQMGDAQKWMGEEIWKLKDKVDALPGVIAEGKADDTEQLEEIGKLREEVKGLYVELSTVKQQIDDTKQDIASVNANVSSFRTSSGLFLAFVVLMVIVSTAMQILRR
jgi:hypothetical protein